MLILGIGMWDSGGAITNGYGLPTFSGPNPIQATRMKTTKRPQQLGKEFGVSLKITRLYSK